MDTRGHINLFPVNTQSKEKNAEAEAERLKEKRDHEDRYTLRFSNAAGFKQDLNAPWYSTASNDDAEVVGKDVWGNDDRGRREREKVRAHANDPLASTILLISTNTTDDFTYLELLLRFLFVYPNAVVSTC